ncbi:MAG: mannitol dehydrogenase family protein [Pseudomonadota bacterium]
MDELMEQEAVKLSDATLASLPETVLRPRYDRTALTPGIVHIGVGNFHRAHQAWYLHRLMQEGGAHDWAILGAGVRPYDAAMREELKAQDCLTTLIELDPSGTSAEVTGPMIDYLPVDPGHARLIDAMSDPAIRLVSLTVTEGGYYVGSDGAFSADDADIRHDAANPAEPRTAFGAIVAALQARRSAGQTPFTPLSCDNLQGNGAVLRQTVTSLARMIDPELADWIEHEAAFPNSMVDCIVPATGPSEIAAAQAFGIEDAAPVTHENFRQWVIEDHFPAGRPDLDRVGVSFTSDVHPYEAMKIRILNAGHQVLANVGEILSLSTIADCMADPQVAAFFRKVQTEEILPHVAAVPETNPAEYLDLVERRFANPAIRDTTRRVAFDGSSRHSGFVLPIIRDALATDAPIRGLMLVEALWARMCAGTREDGTVIEANDPHWADLQTCARAARQEPTLWLRQRAFYGDLCEQDQVTAYFCDHLKTVWSKGARQALDAFLSE